MDYIQESSTGPATLSYLIHHVFMPPKVPNASDLCPEHEQELLETIMSSLRDFRHQIPAHYISAVETASSMLRFMHDTHSSIGDRYAISKDALVTAFQHLVNHDGSLILHVSAQNAAVFIRAIDDRISVEVFEVSPLNNNVLATKGRLRRRFPASSISLPRNTFHDSAFLTSFASTLAKMSQQEVKDTKPQARKAGRMHNEERDTTHPKLITELIMAFLTPLGIPATTTSIWKNTRDEVYYHSSLLPWRRSPLWLVIRVALQLTFSRFDTKAAHLYKSFMLFNMAKILSKTQSCDYHSDLLLAMGAKIRRRRRKLEGTAYPAMGFVQEVLCQTDTFLEQRWQKIQASNSPNPPLSGLLHRCSRSDILTRIPNLDDFISHIESRPLVQNQVAFSPGFSLTKFDDHELPALEASSGDCLVFELVAFETWVADKLCGWVDINRGNVNTCESLSRLINRYHQLANAQYVSNPETRSIMVLTILELYVSCDEAAVLACPLLRDYDTGIPIEVLQNLLLPMKSQMDRLWRIEEYLKERANRSTCSSWHAIGAFGIKESFSARWFSMSSEHQDLKIRTEEWASQCRQATKKEFREKQDDYRRLKRLHDSRDCDMFPVWCEEVLAYIERHIKRRCKRCDYLTQAESISISIHEWPLPSRVFEAQSAVFELLVPSAFGYWRDLTIFVLSDILGSVYSTEQKPRSHYTINEYSQLYRFLQPFKNQQRLVALSEDKPHSATHRRNHRVGTTTEDDVCLDNALHYRYYDSQIGCFVQQLRRGDSLATRCTYSLPRELSPLQRFMSRGPDDPNGPPPNAAIASQSHCPAGMPIEEYKALCSVPLGNRIQWQNILVQLQAPSVNFRTLQSTMMILQCIHQVGPRGHHGAYRESHEVVKDSRLVSALLSSLEEELVRIQGNWQASQILFTTISLACRLHTLSTTEQGRARCLSLLSNARKCGMEWLGDLIEKIHASRSEQERRDLSKRSVTIALITSASFDLDSSNMERVIASLQAASTFLECSIIIQEGKRCLDHSDRLNNLLYQRWQRLSHRIYQGLAGMIVNKDNEPLNVTIHKHWPAFQTRFIWQRASSTHDNWLTVRASNEGTSGVLRVDFNVLDGKLLVDGIPLGRLTEAYESHDTYRKLFGQATIEVMPTAVPGMSFSGKSQFAGYSLHFGMNRQDDLLIRAERNGRPYELIPRKGLKDSFPVALTDEIFHWYDVRSGSVVLCEQHNPWAMSSSTVHLMRSEVDDAWHLKIGTQSLFDLNSKPARVISDIFRPLEDPLHIHCTLNERTTTIGIRLPRLQLEFYSSINDDKIYSRQFRGWIVDKDQGLGTLVGLQSKLILCTQETRHKKLVIIPYGEVHHQPSGNHVAVSIGKSSARRTYAYRVDEQLGRLRQDGDILSRLWLCYLHSLTSFCLPDPLTGRTGTEEALIILKSAAVNSFGSLDVDSMKMLHLISCLSPRRCFYPPHERVMQVVEWSSNLGFLAQHNSFQPEVQRLLDKHTQSRLFCPDDYNESPSLGGVDPHLMERDDIRSSSFRVAEFGAEKFTVGHDSIYPSRDEWNSSSAAQRVAAIGMVVHNEEQRPRYRIPSTMANHIWHYMERHAVVHNDGKPTLSSDLSYDAQWLSQYETYLAQNWINLQRVLSRRNSPISKFSLMIWLSTIAYADDADMAILHAIASFRNVDSIEEIEPPSARSFEVGKGTRVDYSKLRTVLKRANTAFERSPDIMIPRQRYESAKALKSRQLTSFTNNRETALQRLVESLVNQWPCSRIKPNKVKARSSKWSAYFDTDHAILSTDASFRCWYDNSLLRAYVERLAGNIDHVYESFHWRSPSLVTMERKSQSPRSSIEIDDLFACPAPLQSPLSPPDMTWLLSGVSNVAEGNDHLEGLFIKLESAASTAYEKRYVEGLRTSSRLLEGRRKVTRLGETIDHVRRVLKRQISLYDDQLHSSYAAILKAMGLPAARSDGDVQSWPRVSPSLLLQQLRRPRWHKLSQGWQRCLAHYGCVLSYLRQTERRLLSCDSNASLIKELSNTGHQNWDPCEHPEYLLLEIESNITIREVQEQVAEQMRSTEGSQNRVMQLNMGEGKSSVIVPMLVTTLADGTKLVMVIVAKPQAKQMLEMLVTKLGGLLNRPVFQMPFSRAVKLGASDVVEAQSTLERCMEQGGVLLVQPEHILSSKLMTLEQHITGRHHVGRPMLDLLGFLKSKTRNIVDESDENFSTKFELIYTMGMQQPIDHSPERWILIQEVLDIFRSVVKRMQKQPSDSLEVTPSRQGSFARTRILQKDAEATILQMVATQVCDLGLSGFPISRQSLSTQATVYTYITKSELTEDELRQVETSDLWVDTTKPTLLLLRGILAEGVLGFAFAQKRWRVNYGLVHDRCPPTRLAVPYRAKDSPAPRSEFSQPDVVILLTWLSYYYGGLSNNDLFEAFHHLCASDQSDIEYQAWVRDADELHESFRQLSGVNLEDLHQCINRVFPCLRYGKAVVDYFLAHVVFPKEMREFPYKLSASGWDIGERKIHPTTGFSGTNDSRIILPVTVDQLDLPEQAHTNALVLDYILRPENSFTLIDKQQSLRSDAENLLSIVVSMQPSVRVILDVGAQVLELNNVDMSRAWLKLLPDNEQTKAVVFFDDNDHLCVIDRHDVVEPLGTSPYAEQLDTCLVFLDEVHTRGTDLKLPPDYRAAVTLGANLTKDRLIQACMRMRGLGHGQSVVFCVPHEIGMKIQAHRGYDCMSSMNVADIVEWSIRETWRDATRNIPIWATQGRRYQSHEALWARAHTEQGLQLSTSAAREFLEDEAQPLEARYQPLIYGGEHSIPEGTIHEDPIAQRCRTFGSLNHRPAALREEQERELSPEIEREREVQKAPPANPFPHRVHPDVRKFVSTGELLQDSPAFILAFKALCDTSAAKYLDVSRLSETLLVSADFARTVHVDRLPGSHMLDCFQRSAQWILTGPHRSFKDLIQHMVIISPFEANELWSSITESKYVALHLYAPRPNLGYRPLDSLDLFTVPYRETSKIPQSLILELNLFAGQLYFGTYEEYIRVCRWLGLGHRERNSNSSMDSRGDKHRGHFDESQVKFFKTLFTRIRRNCQNIDKTHMGCVLNDRVLTAENFE